MIIHEVPNFVSLSLNSEENYILFDWTDFYVTLPEFKELCRIALDYSLNNNCFYHIVETSKVKSILRPEVIEWFGTEWEPQLVASGLKGIITIVPGVGLAHLSTRSWQATISEPITLINVNDMDEAEKALNEFKIGLFS